MKFNDKEVESKARQEAALQALHDENVRLGLYDYERGFIDGMQHQMQSSVDKAVNRMAQPEQKPVAWMLEGWGPDCGPYFEIYRDDEMGWRNKKEWTPLYTTPPQHALMAEHWKAEYDKLKAACKPLTDDEIDQGLLRTNYAMHTAGAWRDGVEWATKQLKEKNT
jgi:hypothetical protein